MGGSPVHSRSPPPRSHRPQALGRLPALRRRPQLRQPYRQGPGQVHQLPRQHWIPLPVPDQLSRPAIHSPSSSTSSPVTSSPKKLGTSSRCGPFSTEAVSRRAPCSSPCNPSGQIATATSAIGKPGPCCARSQRERSLANGGLARPPLKPRPGCSGALVYALPTVAGSVIL